jgi:hypothetical protein
LCAVGCAAGLRVSGGVKTAANLFLRGSLSNDLHSAKGEAAAKDRVVQSIAKILPKPFVHSDFLSLPPERPEVESSSADVS